MEKGEGVARGGKSPIGPLPMVNEDDAWEFILKLLQLKRS